MVKSLDRSAEIGPTRLVEKSGGASGTWIAGASEPAHG
jgi:molybdenum cofactor biosynthesis enzyme